MNKQEFLFDGEMIDTSVNKSGDMFIVTVGENNFEFQPTGDKLFSVNINGTRHAVAVAKHKETFYVDIDSVLIELKEATEESFAGGAGDHGGEKDKVYAPMPGKIVKLLVEVGDKVVEKQQLVIVEAMKMENPVLSKAAGVVKAVNFSAGDQVDTETAIVELELGE